MISKFHLFVAALAGLLVCSVAGAQTRNASSISPVRRSSSIHIRPAARPPVTSMHPAGTRFQSSQQTSMIQISPSGPFTSGLGPTANSFNFDSTSRVPGLGFDFPHLAAIEGALHNNSLQFGQQGDRGQESFAPILFGGYPYDYGDLGYDQQDQQQEPQQDQQTVQQSQPQPQIIVIQQPVLAQQGADSGSDAKIRSSSVSESQAVAPIPDVGNFILVRRDGHVLLASVFSVVGSQLQYVSPEGIRRTLAMSDLDADATQRMNEARGTTVQFHN